VISPYRSSHWPVAPGLLLVGAALLLGMAASNHAIAVSGDVGGSITNIHRDGNVIGDCNESAIK